MVTNYPEVAGDITMYFEESKLEKGMHILSRIEDIETFHQGFSDLFLRNEIQLEENSLDYVSLRQKSVMLCSLILIHDTVQDQT
jgi:hypothetical protein